MCFLFCFVFVKELPISIHIPLYLSYCIYNLHVIIIIFLCSYVARYEGRCCGGRCDWFDRVTCIWHVKQGFQVFTMCLRFHLVGKDVLGFSRTFILIKKKALYCMIFSCRIVLVSASINLKKSCYLFYLLIFGICRNVHVSITNLHTTGMS